MRRAREARFEALGEQRVGRVRVLLFLTTLGAYTLFGNGVDLWWVAGVLVYALGLSAATGRFYRPWLSWVTVALDVSLVTLALAQAILVAAPIMATNSRTIFEIYFVTIAIAGVRGEWRLCVWAAVLAAAEFLGVWRRRSGRAMREFPVDTSYRDLYGTFQWGSSLLRVTWLIVAGAVIAAVVQQGRRTREFRGVDALTGLAEREPFVEQASDAMTRATAAKGVALAVIDVDDFRAFVEEVGEGAGERALVVLARRLQACLRPADFAARFGGEEFVVAMADIEPDEAVCLAEEWRKTLGQVRVAGRGEPRHLTVSIGVGCWPTDGLTFEEVLARADARLFYAQEEGRDRVVGPPKKPLATVTELVPRS